MLLVTPCFPHPRSDIEPALVEDFRSSFTRHFSRGKNIKLNPEFWDYTRRLWLVMRLITLDGLQDYRYFTELYTLAYQPDTEISVPRLFKGIRMKDEFVLMGIEECAGRSRESR
jgi:hypothetical protein